MKTEKHAQTPAEPDAAAWGGRQAIRQDLAALAARELDWEGALPEGPLADALDSLELMTLVVAVEDHFQVILEPADEERIATVDDLVELIADKMRGGTRWES